MNTSHQLARHVREVFFGGNWTVSSFREHLADITVEEALTKKGSMNSIAALVYHVHYFIAAVIPVLSGGVLNASDKVSFDHPDFKNADDWRLFLEKVFHDAEKFASLVQELPDQKLEEIFANEKYGTYFRNISGIVEHSHYHLGQVVILKKLVREVLNEN